MGPTVHSNLQNFELRPFNTSRTFANLKRTRSGVVHVTDDVGLIAQSAIGKLIPLPEFFPAEKITGQVIANTCRWYEFQVEYIDENSARTNINCKTLHTGRIRDFWGFNRAKHAVIEAAILATRLDFLPREEIQEQFQRLETIVSKTGSAQESKAFQLLSEHVGHQTGENPSA
jgi:hypothetical protein